MRNRFYLSAVLTLFILALAASDKCLAGSGNRGLIAGTWHRVIDPGEKYITSAMVVFSEDGTLWGSSEYQGIDLRMILKGTYQFLADNTVQINYELTKVYGSGKSEREQVKLLWYITGLTDREMTIEFLPERKQKFTYKR
ncbi:MAG: hypothetical protein RDV48_25630 [Candidatus Eremiobacteraeota bacterium]|nr:hypothetical protein [Candidatus Eremiobacteraeota bacterium]